MTNIELKEYWEELLSIYKGIIFNNCNFAGGINGKINKIISIKIKPDIFVYLNEFIGLLYILNFNGINKTPIYIFV